MISEPTMFLCVWVDTHLNITAIQPKVSIKALATIESTSCAGNRPTQPFKCVRSIVRTDGHVQEPAAKITGKEEEEEEEERLLSSDHWYSHDRIGSYVVKSAVILRLNKFSIFYKYIYEGNNLPAICYKIWAFTTLTLLILTWRHYSYHLFTFGTYWPVCRNLLWLNRHSAIASYS